MTFLLDTPAVPKRLPVTLAMTLVVDPDNIVEGDLHLENGQVHWWDGLEAKMQKTVVLLRFFQGEWFLNVEEGIPYFTHVLIKNPNTRVVVALLKKALLASPGASQVKSCQLSLDRAARTATVTFELLFDDGAVLTSADFVPFVLRLP